MNRLNIISAVCFAIVTVAAQGQSDTPSTKPDLPTDEQISQIFNQADRALLMNKHCLLAEESITVTDPAKAMKTDNEGQKMAEQIVEKIRSDPDYFHGGMGVLLLTALDDVSRNAALSSASLMQDAMRASLVEGAKSHKALEQIKESNSCTESSASIYTVSENLNDLVIKELKAQNEISAERDALLAKFSQCSK